MRLLRVNRLSLCLYVGTMNEPVNGTKVLLDGSLE